LAGCNKKSGSTVRIQVKVRVGYIGLTCEVDLRTWKGFSEGEGLEPELVKCNWSTYGLPALGGTLSLITRVMYFLKPIEQGLMSVFWPEFTADACASKGRENEHSRFRT
jgi:hypothetical protein